MIKNKVDLPDIFYLQTTTRCQGHCVYCPFDDVYTDKKAIDMTLKDYRVILAWLKENDYHGRIGFLLHYDPAEEKRLVKFINVARETLSDVQLEGSTGSTEQLAAFKMLDLLDVVKAGSKKVVTSRAENVRKCKQIKGRLRLRSEEPSVLD